MACRYCIASEVSLLCVCRKNRPSEEVSITPAEAPAVASCASTVVDRSGDSESHDVASPTSVDLERLCASSCTPASYDEPIIELPDEVQPLTGDGDDDGATAAVWIETTASKSPPPSSPSSIVWRSRELHDLGTQSAASDRRRRTAEDNRFRWLPRSPVLEVLRPAAQPESTELLDPSASRGDVDGRRVSGSRLPNGIIPGARSSSPPTYQYERTPLQPVTLARPRSESNFAAAVAAAAVAQRSNAVERLRSFPCRSPGGDDAAARPKRRRRTVDLAPAVASSSYVVSVDDVNRSKLGRVTKEELYRMWKSSERSLHAQLRVAMQQKAELQQILQAAGLASAERLTVT